MAEQLELLKQLQGLDAKLYKFRRQQQDKPRELEQVAARVAAQEAKTKTAEERFKAAQLSQKDKEMELQTREGQVKKLQGQLFQVKTNKEYTAMQREIESLKADNSVLEEDILTLFDAIDQAAKQRQREHALLAEEQQRLQAERARIEQELAAIGEQVAILERERHGMVSTIDPQSLVVYERILDMREGVALVPLMDESCGGCHRRLPPQVVNEVFLKARLVTCESCNRILYCDDVGSKL